MCDADIASVLQERVLPLKNTVDESNADPSTKTAKAPLTQQKLNVNITGPSGLPSRELVLSRPHRHKPAETARLPVICALVQDTRAHFIGV